MSVLGKGSHHYQPPTVALAPVDEPELLIRKLPFLRLVREIAQDFKPDCKFDSRALLTLQLASEAYLVSVLETSQQSANLGNRAVVEVFDIQCATGQLPAPPSGNS